MTEETDFDRYKETYADNIRDSIAFAGQEHDFYLRVKADHINSLLPDKASMLDVGCGVGLIHKHLKPGTKLTGIDPASTVITDAKKANPDHTYLSFDGQAFPFKDDSFDFSMAICVMHHVPPRDWLMFLYEMKRVTKPGGMIAIYEHNPWNPLTLHVVKTCPFDHDAVLLSSAKTSSLFRTIRLDPKTEYMIFTPFEQSLFRKFDKAMKFLPLGAQYVTYATV